MTHVAAGHGCAKVVHAAFHVAAEKYLFYKTKEKKKTRKKKKKKQEEEEREKE